MKIIIKPKKITRKNFKKFGDLISTKKVKSISINNGYANRFNDLCRINTSFKKGITITSIFSAKKRKFPINIKMMEKHPLGSQAFIPMKETKFLVFVAPNGGDLKYRVFRVSHCGEQNETDIDFLISALETILNNYQQTENHIILERENY